MATTDLVVAGGLVTYQGSGFPTLDGTIIETFNNDDIMPEHKQYMSIMDYTDTPLLNPSQTFTTKSAPTSMGNVLETGIPENADMVFTPKKVSIKSKSLESIPVLTSSQSGRDKLRLFKVLLTQSKLNCLMLLLKLVI